MDISFSAGAARRVSTRSRIWQLATATAFWLPNGCQMLLGNWQPQQAPLKGCACSCGLPLPDKQPSRGFPSTTRAARHPDHLAARFKTMAISCNGEFTAIRRKSASGGGGRGRANDDESRACVCLTVEMPDAGRIERRGRSISCAAGRPKVARGVVFGVEFVTIL